MIEIIDLRNKISRSSHPERSLQGEVEGTMGGI